MLYEVITINIILNNGDTIKIVNPSPIKPTPIKKTPKIGFTKREYIPNPKPTIAIATKLTNKENTTAINDITKAKTTEPKAMSIGDESSNKNTINILRRPLLLVELYTAFGVCGGVIV